MHKSTHSIKKDFLKFPKKILGKKSFQDFRLTTLDIILLFQYAGCHIEPLVKETGSALINGAACVGGMVVPSKDCMAKSGWNERQKVDVNAICGE